MRNGAQPISLILDWNTVKSDSWGLTKREYFAGLAMQGLMTKAHHSRTDNENVADVAKLIAEASILIADELLKQLEK